MTIYKTDADTLSEELGAPLDRTEYTLEELNQLIRRDTQAVVDALIWTREQWKWFQPRHDDGHQAAGHDPGIWYDEAVRKLFKAAVDIDNEEGIYEQPESYGLDPEYAGLVALAFEYYREHYDSLRHGPDDGAPPRSYD